MIALPHSPSHSVSVGSFALLRRGPWVRVPGGSPVFSRSSVDVTPSLSPLPVLLPVLDLPRSYSVTCLLAQQRTLLTTEIDRLPVRRLPGFPSFQGELNDDAPHDIVELVISPLTQRMFIVTRDTGVGDRSIRIDGFKVGKLSCLFSIRIYCAGIIRHRL